MTWLLGWVLDTKLGRWAAGASAIVSALVLLWLAAVQHGKSSERAAAARASLDNVRKRQATDEEVARMSPAARRERLRDWSSR